MLKLIIDNIRLLSIIKLSIINSKKNDNRRTKRD
jgi:hypothetical protein